jgi:ABC-type glycerol-3-phosphate transport system substrate-binding protein
MPDVARSPEAGDGHSLLERPLSRRQVIRGGLLAGGAAFLAACGAAATPAPTAAPATAAPASAAPATAAPATPTPAPSESFAGLQLHNFTGGYMIPWLTAGTAAWKAATGGDALSDNVDFASKQIKQAGVIATQDSSYDMMYTTSAYGYIPKFAARLLLPVTSDAGSYGADLSDFFDGAKKALTTGDGVLRALPLYASPAIWTWNKTLFTKIGEDPENPPDNYPALFKLVPKFKAAGIIPSIQPWLATQAILFAQLYFTYIFNSTDKQMFSPDFTQLGFDNDTGLEVFNVIEEGFKSGFWDPKYMNIVNEHDGYKLFLDGNVATIRWSESPIATGAMADPKNVGIRQQPGYRPGTTGSTGGPDGLGVSKFSKNPDACWSWSKRNFSKEIGLAAATTIKDSTGALVLYATARTSVATDPAVIKAQPLQPVYAQQNKGNTNPWSTPYDTTPVFNEVIAKMISGDYTGAQAHNAAVKGCQDLIIKYLSS